MKKNLTPYLELDDALTGHCQKINDVLGDNFVGMYLQGSLAIGDFDLSSDVDFIVVTNGDLSEKQVDNVQRVHSSTYNQDNKWVKHFEYSFFPKYLLNKHSSPFINGVRNDSNERKLWYFDNGSPTIERSDHCNTLVTRWTVREKGITLIGPDPKLLIDPINQNDLRTEIKDTMIGWGDYILKNPGEYRNRFYQSYLVLNYSRMFHDLFEGRVASKLAGINWAKSNIDPKWFDLIDYCFKERQDTKISIKQPANPQVYKKSLEFVKYIVALAQKFKII